MTAEGSRRRIVVIGCPGAGKTTTARMLSDKLGLRHIELDALYHGPGWVPTPTDELRASLATAMDEAEATVGGWVVCGNYNTQTGGLHLARADTLIWLDLSRSVIMRRVIWRTVKRAALRRELWNGNREPMSNFLRWDPEENIMRWAWTRHPKYRIQYSGKLSDGSWDHLTVHRLTTESEVDGFLAGVTG